LRPSPPPPDHLWLNSPDYSDELERLVAVVAGALLARISNFNASGSSALRGETFAVSPRLSSPICARRSGPAEITLYFINNTILLPCEY
jgi:hypothetical protein